MGKRIGIVGTGFIAMKHLAAFKAQKKAEIVGMCTYSNMEKLHAICEEHQIIPFASMDEMLEKGELDCGGSLQRDCLPLSGNIKGRRCRGLHAGGKARGG